jgi:hypothetical protein
MSNRARSEVNSTASSGASEGLANALRESIDLSLVAESSSSNRAHSKSTVEHSKSRTDGQVLPKLSGAARERALRLAGRLASIQSD